MEVTALGMVTEVRPLQLLKAPSPMVVTELGMETYVRPVQSEKAALPMEMTELGMVTDVNRCSLMHKYGGIILTLLPKEKLVILVSP